MSTAPVATWKPSAADLAAFEVVNMQFGGCALNPKFFEDFYQDFTSQSAEIRAKFAGTDMKAQKDALRNGLTFLIMFATGKHIAIDKLDRLGKTHARTGYNIRPEMYPLWINALIRTVARHTHEFDTASDKAWRHVLQLGVNRITSWY